MRRCLHLIVLAIFASLISGCGSSEPIVARLSYLNGRSDSWIFRVEADAQAMIVENFSIPHEAKATPEQQAQLRALIESEKFFELADKYGEPGKDVVEHNVLIQLGEKAKEIRLYGDLAKTDPKNPEIERVLKVWKLISSWTENKKFKWARAG